MCKKIYQSMPWVKGQIWLVREPDSVTDARIKAGTHLMVKTRPYLIYMAEESAQLKFNIVQGFPIPSNDRLSDDREKSYYDFDIRFKNQEGHVNRIITGQLTSIDCRYLSKYICSLPTELMDELDALVAERFGYGDHLLNLSTKLDAMKKEIAEMEEKASALFHSFNYESTKDGKLIPTEIRDETSDAPVIKPEETVYIDRTESGRIRWNDSTASLFLQHCEEKSSEQIQSIWGIEPERIAQTKCYCKKKLGGGGYFPQPSSKVNGI